MEMNPQLTGAKKQFFQNRILQSQNINKMKKILFILSIILLFSASSCVTTLQPVVTYNTAVTDSRLEGSWEQDGQEYIVKKVFNSELYDKFKDDIEKSRIESGKLSEKEKKDSVLYSKSYIIKYIKDGIAYELFGNMIKLNGRLFMNFTPADMNTTGPSIDKEKVANISNTLYGHTIARVQFNNNNSLSLDFIDGGYVYDEIKAGHMKIKHEIEENYDTFLITASTSELQQFLEKYGDDKRFFNKENSVTLIRKS